jgi:hypothetical protein
MSDFVISPKAAETALSTTPSNISLASLVRLLNTSASVARLITKKNVGGTLIGSVTIQFGQDMVILKNPTDTLEQDVGTDVKAVSIAFR